MPAQASATPSNRRANQTSHSASLVRVRPAGAMGKGLFAAQDIARGTRVIDETPLFVVYDQPRHGDSSEEAFEQDVSAFCETTHDLPAEKLHKLDQLYYDASYDTVDNKDRVLDWYRAQGVTDEKGLKLNGRKLSQAVMTMAKRYTIFKDNCARVGEDETGEDSGLFVLYSRINHSCSPNAHAHYNGTTERLTVHATRDIKAGEQVFVQYFDNACLPRDQRQNQAKGFGFVCACPACNTDLATEPLRERVHQLEQGIRQYVEKDPFGPAHVPNSPDQALRDVEELIGLLEHPSINLQNSTLRNAFVPHPSSDKDMMRALKKYLYRYRAGFKITLENGDVQKATEYAQRDLELTIYMVGTDDTEYLHGDDKDGQLGYWFRQLENMGDM
ncbi:hypothetical protein VPNG_09746 [Cytospora leucostoma]|uniref:SET domain-containing protein n=1 Tax=Cytospora leucostoma TaxID=1230097 RepID=A0A423VKU4_9PEZI|nr:hypothetical protein VPNG_09746 [Cytospora leucostoma]